MCEANFFFPIYGQNVVETWLKRGFAACSLTPRSTITMTTTTSLFQSIPERDPLGFWDGDRLIPVAVVKFLRFSKADVASISMVAATSVRYDQRMPRAMLQRLARIAHICALVARHFEGDAARTRLWFTTSNPWLEYNTPRDMILLGRCDALHRLVAEAREPDAAAADPGSGTSAVPSLILAQQSRITALCLRYGVRQLALVGSILKDDPGSTPMFDMMVELGPAGQTPAGRQHADLNRDLAQLLGRPVDLLEITALPDCRLKRLIQRTKVPIYAAAG